jgi:co-chaperonin GroES (HSP10)
MQANPDKFQVLAVGKETYDKKKKPSMHIQNSDLICEKNS